MALGRPTDYSDEVVKQAQRYADNYETETSDEIPSVVGLAQYIGRGRSTINRWKNEEGKEAFRDILDKINELQRNKLINEGLNGTFNAAITKLVLGKHGYHDHTKVDNTVHLTDMSQDELDAKILRLQQLTLDTSD